MSDAEDVVAPDAEEETKPEIQYERKVLLPVDGSHHSYRALKWYCENLHQVGDLLMICHCLEIPPIPPTPFPYGVGYYEDWRRQIDEARDASKALLMECAKTCDAYMVEKQQEGEEPQHCHKQLIREERDRPGHALCLLAKEEKADLVVIGSRGQSTIRRTFLGSVSDHVVHHAHIPVAVVPPRPKNAPDKGK
ncbi:universal stress protein in QAH/OAS sulfhydrylase 3'region [Nematostella vectensis]|uniref:universal stress protein in QAH/OAS sulfhydrylase 3'region n=1 Tax=Nematostella vectensis TaxID=45351 RepID=UPI00138FC3BE|nr:universal stress protein in QAH/OAS sulfhydrylase 3'region [Nematostella vectensis]